MRAAKRRAFLLRRERGKKKRKRGSARHEAGQSRAVTLTETRGHWPGQVGVGAEERGRIGSLRVGLSRSALGFRKSSRANDLRLPWLSHLPWRWPTPTSTSRSGQLPPAPDAALAVQLPARPVATMTTPKTTTCRSALLWHLLLSSTATAGGPAAPRRHRTRSSASDLGERLSVRREASDAAQKGVEARACGTES